MTDQLSRQPLAEAFYLNPALLDEIRKADPTWTPDLTGTKMVGWTLTGIDLHGADLSHADMTFIDLTGANLRDADLSFASLVGSVLVDVDATGANFEGTSLHGAVMTGVVGANVTKAKGTHASTW